MLAVITMQLVRLRLEAIQEGGHNLPLSEFLHSMTQHAAWYIGFNFYDRRKCSHRRAAVHACEQACKLIDRLDVFAGDELQDTSEAKRVLIYAASILKTRDEAMFAAAV